MQPVTAVIPDVAVVVSTVQVIWLAGTDDSVTG